MEIRSVKGLGSKRQRERMEIRGNKEGEREAAKRGILSPSIFFLWGASFSFDIINHLRVSHFFLPCVLSVILLAGARPNRPK